MLSIRLSVYCICISFLFSKNIISAFYCFCPPYARTISNLKLREVGHPQWLSIIQRGYSQSAATFWPGATKCRQYRSHIPPPVSSCCSSSRSCRSNTPHSKIQGPSLCIPCNSKTSLSFYQTTPC